MTVKGEAAYRARYKRRGLGFNPLSLDHKGCDWHHINEIDVVAVPIWIHRNIKHSLYELSSLKIHDNKGENSFQDETTLGFKGNPLRIEGVLG